MRWCGTTFVMPNTSIAPIPGSYWAAPGLLAGPLPTAEDREGLRTQVRALLDAGVRTVIDLRTSAEPPGIGVLFEKLAADADEVAGFGLPILNGDVPTIALVQLGLDLIDASLARGRAVYLHCAGGRGRTGTFVACWWIRHGMHDGESALAALMRHRAALVDGHMPSPETAAQYRRVRAWPAGG